MDEKLQNIFKLKQLQHNVITLRTEMPAIYDKWLKCSQSIQLKRLMKVQMEIPVTELSIPEQATIRASNCRIQPKCKTDIIESVCQNLQKIFDFIE